MRILCLIMVGAFLLSIAIADNGNSMRPSTQNLRNQLPLPTTMNHGLHQSTATNNPWSTRRVAQNAPVLHVANEVMTQNSIGAVTLPASQFLHQDVQNPKPMHPTDNIMIIEPIQPPRESSWVDWMPDFFGDDTTEGSPPLIGPLNLPGMGSQVYIKQHEPLDDDTEHVVIHLINRDPHAFPQHVQQQALQQQNQLAYFTKDSAQRPESFSTIENSQVSPGKSPVSEYIYGRNESPTNLHPNMVENEIQKKKSVQSTDGGLQMSHEEAQSKFTVMVLKQAGVEPPRIVWSQPINHRDSHYGRSLNHVESIDTIAYSSTPQAITLSSNSTSIDPKDSNTEGTAPQYTALPRYGYQNNTNVASESVRVGISPPQSNRAQAEIPRFKPAANYLDEIAILSKAEHVRRQVNRGDGSGSPISLTGTNSYTYPDGLSRTPRNRYSATKHFAKVNNPQRMAAAPVQQKFSTPEIDSGGIRIVPAPNFRELVSSTTENLVVTTEKTSTNKTGEEVMQNIMSMTASQTWKNVPLRSPKMIEPKKTNDSEWKKSTPLKSVEIERRMDDGIESAETKETPRTVMAISSPLSNKSSKAEIKMKEAVRKLMSSFTQWRHKVVSTEFVKELDGKKKNRSKVTDDSTSR